MKDYPAIDSHGRERTPYAINCMGVWDVPGGSHGLVYLTSSEYDRQISTPDRGWRCPLCHYDAVWDDGNYEQFDEAGTEGQ